jgi:hypothetical protein
VRHAGALVALVDRIIGEDQDTLALFREATVGKQGAHGDNVTMKPERGNSAYTLDRLKRENRDLFDKVVAGELSAQCGGDQAFRKKLAPVPPSPRLTIL